MMFGKRLTRAVGLGLVAGLLTLSTARAQNENNWTPLSNGFDGYFLGIGASGPGQSATGADGVGTWIAGEDLRGSKITTFSGDYGFKMVDIEHVSCFIGTGGTGKWQPDWSWWEYDGRNTNKPDVFTNPACIAPGLIAGTATGAPLGTPGPAGPGGGTASLLVAGLPSFIGTASFVLPNNGLLPTTTGGTLTFAGGFFIASSNGGPVGVPTGCFSFEFGFAPTTLIFLDDIDGAWHWHKHGASPSSVNYFGFTFDEVNPWQSRSLFTASNLSQAGGAIFTLPAVFDYNYSHQSFEAATSVALAPNGAGTGVYYANSVNTNGGSFGIGAINVGYDVGRGSQTISFAGATGYADANDVPITPILAPQDPAGGSGGGGLTVPTMQFHTWDTRDYNGNMVADDGGNRVVWFAFNFDAFGGGPFTINSSDVMGDLAPNGLLQDRVPVTLNDVNGFGAGVFPQPSTLTLLIWLNHFTIPSGLMPDVQGFLPPAGQANTAGTSKALGTAGVASSVCTGVSFPATIGTTGLISGGLWWNSVQSSVGDRKTLYFMK
jgi:hypothetical protein